MKKIWAIAQKEVMDNLQTPMGYIILALTTVIFNTFFFIIIDENREATLRDMFILMEFLFVFLIPLLTMRAFAEEKSTGTMEFLMTSPLTNTQIVLGKYIGSLLFLAVIILLSFIYYIIIEIFGTPDRMSVWLGYKGIGLEAAFFIAIGLLTSSWTKNQVLAALTSYAIIFSLYFSVTLTKYASGIWKKIIVYSNVTTHSANLFAGLLTTSDIIYFLSGIVLCLVLTRLSIENRLWR